MKTKLVLLAMAMLVVAIPAMAGGDKCAAGNAQACLSHWASEKSHAWTGLDLDKSVPGVIKVKAIAPNSPAATAGFEVGDELVALNGASMADKDAVKKAKGEWKAGQAVTYTVKRKGAEQQVAVTLAEMPKETLATMLGQHMLDAHVAMATATATETKSEVKLEVKPEVKAASADKK